jgi:hypothetical protein
MEARHDSYELALAGDALGHRFVPCAPGTKVPIVRWKQFQAERPTPDLYARWFRGTRNNIAVLTSGMVLFDCDDPAQADLVLDHCGDTPWKVRTPRGGIHLGFRRRLGVALRNQVKVKGTAIDIRTDGGLEMIPNSETEHGAYVWLGAGLLAIADLPVAKIGWTRERTRRRARAVVTEGGVLPEGKGAIRFPEAYCLRIESVQGQNGSRGLVRVVCILRDAGRSATQIFDFVQRVWNPACARPEWSDREILHCLERHGPA